MSELLKDILSDKTDNEKKIIEGYMNGILILMKQKPLLEFTEEELYNEINNGMKQNKPLAKYIKTAYINLCILIREKNGLTNDFLKQKTKRRVKSTDKTNLQTKL